MVQPSPRTAEPQAGFPVAGGVDGNVGGRSALAMSLLTWSAFLALTPGVGGLTLERAPWYKTAGLVVVARLP